jgi:hypothetical protein
MEIEQRRALTCIPTYFGWASGDDSALAEFAFVHMNYRGTIQVGSSRCTQAKGDASDPAMCACSLRLSQLPY